MTETSTPNALTAHQIAELLDATVLGDANQSINSVAVIERAEAGQLAFVGSLQQIRRCEDSAASVILAPPEVTDCAGDYPNVTFVLVEDPEAALLKVALKLKPARERSTIGISPLATVASTAKIGSRTNVHPYAVIGEDVLELGVDAEVFRAGSTTGEVRCARIELDGLQAAFAR